MFPETAVRVLPEKIRRRSYAGLLLVFTFFITIGAFGDTIPIKLHTDNPHYFDFRGEPTILITSGEHYSAVQNLDFDYIPYLNELQDEGLNYTRLFNGTYVDGTPEDLPMFNGGNVWIPVGAPLYPDEINDSKSKGLISPWARSNVPGYVGGGNKFDLDTWDTAYFNRLKDFVEEASDRGIVVEITFFCGFSLEYFWSLSPYNYINNINNIGKFGTAYGPYDDNGDNIGHLYPLTMASDDDGLLAYFDAMVEKTIEELVVYDNVFFEISNEPYFEDAGSLVINQNGEHCGSGHGVSTEWHAHMAQTIINKLSQYSEEHLIAQNIDAFYETVEIVPSNTDPNSIDKFTKVYPEVDILNFHYSARKQTYINNSIGNNYDLDRPIACDETGNVGGDDHIYRKQAWNYILAGGAVYNNLDMSFTTNGYEGGRPTNPSSGYGGSPEYREQLGILSEFINEFDFINMVLNNDLPKSDGFITLTNPTTLDVRGLSKDGEEYAVYVEGGTQATLTVNIPAGDYTADWINTKGRDGSGNIIVVKSTTFTHDGGSKVLSSPTYTENDIALRIVSGTPDPDPDPVTGSDEVGYWSMDEGSGNTTADLTANGNDGTLLNNPTWVAGVGGMALEFDGVDDKVDCGEDQVLDMGTGDFTISGWVKMTADQNSYPTIVGKGAGGDWDKGYWLIVHNGKLRLFISNGTSRVSFYSNADTFTDDAWHHVAITLDRDGNITFYNNGVQIGSTDFSQFNGDDISMTNPFTIGSWQNASSSFLKGSIDDIRLFSDALSAAQVDSLAQGINPDPDPDTNPNPDSTAVAQWSLDEGSGNTTADISGNGNDGTLLNNPTWITGIDGMALSFDGLDDKIDCGDDNILDIGTGDFSISGWIKMPADQNSYPTIIGKGAGADWDQGYWLIVHNNKLRLFISDGTSRVSYYSAADTFTDDSWHHVAVTMDRDADITFYLNGTDIGSTDFSQFDGHDISKTNPFTIGSWQNTSSTFLNGGIDDIRLYADALTAAQVDSLAQGINPDPDPDPNPNPDSTAVAQWSLDEGSGNTTADISGNGNDGTLLNNPIWTTGVSGMALKFDGVDDKLDCGSGSTLEIGAGDFSISTWIKMSAAQNNYPTIVGKGAGANTDEGYWFIVKNSKLRLFISDGITRISFNSDIIPITDNSWHHIAVTLDRDGDHTFFFDGVAVGNGDISSFAGKNIISDDNFTVAVWQNNPSTNLNASLDDLKLFPTALTQVEIDTLSTYGVSESPNPDVAIDRDMKKGDISIDLNVYPNPTKGSSNISFKLPENSHVNVSVFNINGQMIRTLNDGQLESGIHYMVWDGKNRKGADTGDGLFFIRIVSKDQVVLKQILRLR